MDNPIARSRAGVGGVQPPHALADLEGLAAEEAVAAPPYRQHGPQPIARRDEGVRRVTTWQLALGHGRYLQTYAADGWKGGAPTRGAWRQPPRCACTPRAQDARRRCLWPPRPAWSGSRRRTPAGTSAPPASRPRAPYGSLPLRGVKRRLARCPVRAGPDVKAPRPWARCGPAARDRRRRPLPPLQPCSPGALNRGESGRWRHDKGSRRCTVPIRPQMA